MRTIPQLVSCHIGGCLQTTEKDCAFEKSQRKHLECFQHGKMINIRGEEYTRPDLIYMHEVTAHDAYQNAQFLCVKLKLDTVLLCLTVVQKFLMDMDALDPGLQQASVNTSENNTKVRTPSCVNSRAGSSRLDRRQNELWQPFRLLAELSGSQVSFQSQIETSEEVQGVQSAQTGLLGTGSFSAKAAGSVFHCQDELSHFTKRCIYLKLQEVQRPCFRLDKSRVGAKCESRHDRELEDAAEWGLGVYSNGFHESKIQVL